MRQLCILYHCKCPVPKSWLFVEGGKTYKEDAVKVVVPLITLSKL